MSRRIYAWLVLIWIGCCASAVLAQQSFTFHSDSLVNHGPPGHAFDIYADIHNISSQDLHLRIIRVENNLPPDPGWESNLCNGVVCYAPNADTITIPDPFVGIPPLAPDSTAYFHLQVRTNPTIPGTATITIRVENMADTSDNASLTFTVSTQPTGVAPEKTPDIEGFALYPNFPNPFNPATRIAYTLPPGGGAELTWLIIYDQQGRRVRTLVHRRQGPGYYEVVWDGRNDRGKPVAGGVYWYHLRYGKYRATRALVLVK